MELVPAVTIGVLEGPDHYMLGEINSLAVSPQGAIYVFDSHAPALRKYSADGEYLYTLGRDGGGPGEYQNPDGGLAVLPDGRVVLRDPGNGRFNVYSADGEALDGWGLPDGGSFNSSERLYTDTVGSIYTLVLLERDKRPWEWTYGLVRYTTTGVHDDTIPAPTWDFDRHVVTGQTEGSSSSTRVPFSPTTFWTFSRLGYMVGGVSGDYRVDSYRAPGDVLRIEKDWTPVEVAADEGEERERRIGENFSRQFPGWRWNGPPIPQTKPAFNALFAGEDGTIWVAVSQPGYLSMTADEAREEEQLSGRVQMRYSELVAFDVFDAEGRFLGHVRAPRSFQLHPSPIFDGERVWAVARDELDVASIVTYRVTRQSTEHAVAVTPSSP
jgi:hypothetical protein